jgi:hypothetical protein
MKKLFGFTGKTVLLNEDGTLGELGSGQLQLFLQGNQRDTEMVFFQMNTERPDPVFKNYDLRIRVVNISDTESLRTVIKHELAGCSEVVLAWIRDNFESGLSWFNVLMRDLEGRPL